MALYRPRSRPQLVALVNVMTVCKIFFLIKKISLKKQQHFRKHLAQNLTNRQNLHGLIKLCFMSSAGFSGSVKASPDAGLCDGG